MMSITNRVNQVYIDDGAVPSKNLDKPVSVPLKNIKSTNPTTDNKPVTKKETPNNQKKVEVYDFDFDYDFKNDIKKISDVENRIASILKTFKTENIYKYNEVGTTVSSNSNGLWSNVTNLWDNTTDKVRDFFSDVGADVSNAATGLWSETKSWWSDVEDWWAADALPWFKEASKNVWDVYSSTCATLSIAVVSLVEGVLQFGEAIVDFLALVGTGYCSIYTGLMDVGQAFWGAITGEEWSSLTKQMWNGTMGFVSEQYVAGWFDSLYANTRWGNYFKSKAYGFDVVRSVGTGIGYIAGVVALTVATFGAGSVVATGGSVSVTAATAATSTTQMAITATAAGIGKGVQNAWADGADLVEGLFSGTLTGVWEGVQFYIGGKIGAAGGWGDKIAGKLLGPNASGVTNKIVSSISRVLLDGIDGGVEGFVQPLLSSIYKDGYYVEDGENSKFVEFKDDMNVLERYKELFDDNGGWTAVWTEASIGSATSLLGEVFDLGKYFKDSKQTNADVKPNTEVKNLEQKNIDNQNLASNVKQELQKKFDDYVNQANYYASKGNFYSIKIENFDDIPTEFWDKVNDPTKIFFVKDGKRIDFFEARALSELDMSVDDVPTEISKLNYKKHKATKYAVEYLKSNVRKFAYKNTNVFDGLNTQIMENGLYHFTDASDEILESGYIKASGRSDSYGNKKTFFFNGIPEVGAYATNLDKLPIKTTAVRVQPTVDLVNSSKLKLRYIDDMAITFDGKFDLSGYDAEKCFFVLTTENGQLKYKQVSETIYNNYETTNIGKALSQYVSDKNNVVDIKSDFLSEISNRNGMSEFDGLTEDILVRPNMEITGKLLNVKQLMEIIQEPDKFSKFIDFKNNSDYFDGTKLEYAIGLKQVIESCEKNKIDLGITDIKKLEITKYLDDYIKNGDNLVTTLGLSIDELGVASSINLKSLDEQIVIANTYTDSGGVYRLDIDKIDDFTLKQIEQLKNPDSIYVDYDGNRYSVSDFKNMLRCESKLKFELLQSVKDINDPALKARKLYMELNKKLHYNMDYIKSGTFTQNQILNKVTNFSNLDTGNRVVCKGWSELFYELLIESGFDKRNVVINVAGQHRWVEIELGNGYIIQADATEAINNSIDLSASKGGYATSGFICINNEEGGWNGLRPRNIVASDSCKGLLDSNNRWLLEIDKHLGYAGENGYLVDEITKSKSLFGNSSLANKLFGAKINSKKTSMLFDLELPNNMDGYEAYAYYKTVSDNLFGKEQNPINLRTFFLKTKNGIEAINCMDASGDIIQIYSTSLGKIRFDNVDDANKFIKSLDIIERGEVYAQ